MRGEIVLSIPLFLPASLYPARVPLTLTGHCPPLVALPTGSFPAPRSPRTAYPLPTHPTRLVAVSPGFSASLPARYTRRLPHLVVVTTDFVISSSTLPHSSPSCARGDPHSCHPLRAFSVRRVTAFLHLFPPSRTAWCHSRFLASLLIPCPPSQSPFLTLMYEE